MAAAPPSSSSASRPQRDDYIEKSPTGIYAKLPDLVGKGSFKTVYRAQDLEHGTVVAWNEISIRNLQSKEKKRIFNELTLLKTMQHPYLIRLYGAWVNKEAEK